MARGLKTGGGSRKGRPNNSTLQSREALWAYIRQQESQGQRANPYEVLVHLMLSTEDERIMLGCAKELATYLLPKLTAVKLSGDADEPVRTVYHVTWEARLQKALDRLEQVRHGNGQPHPEAEAP